MSSHRKPYIRPIKRTWWLNHAFYRYYMLREATVLPLILFTFFLTCGLGALVKGPASWQHWLAFMQHPIVLVINGIALAASLFHAFTYFTMMPQVVPIRIQGKPVSHTLIIAIQWAVVAVISLLVLYFV